MCRQSECHQDLAGFHQEQFCFVMRGRYYIRYVPAMVYACSDRRLHGGKPGVAVNLSKGINHYEIRNEAQNLVNGLKQE